MLLAHSFGVIYHSQKSKKDERFLLPLRSELIPEVPFETVRVVRATCPKGNISIICSSVYRLQCMNYQITAFPSADLQRRAIHPRNHEFDLPKQT